MCLAVPGLIKSIDGKEAIVEIGGISRCINIWLTPEAEVGNYVLLHAGFAISILDEAEAKETIEMFKDILSREETE